MMTFSPKMTRIGLTVMIVAGVTATAFAYAKSLGFVSGIL